MLFAFFVSTFAFTQDSNPILFLEMCITCFSIKWTHLTPFPYYGTRDGYHTIDVGRTPCASPFHRFVGVSDWSGLAHVVGGLFRRTSSLVSYHGDGRWIHSFFSLVLRLVFYGNIHRLYVTCQRKTPP